MAVYPGGVISFTTKTNGQTIDASHIDDLQAEVTAIENALVNGGFTIAGAVTVTGALTASATLGVTGNATIGGTLGVTGVATFTAVPVFSAGLAAITSSGIITGTVFHPTAAPAAAGSIGFSGNTLVNQGGTSGHQWANSANNAQLAGLSDAGQWSLGTNITDAITAPTISSGFGSGPAIAGKVYAFLITVGTGSPTSGVVAFNMTFANAPIATANFDQPIASQSIGVVTTTTGLTLSFQSAVTAGVKVHVHVRGY